MLKEQGEAGCQNQDSAHQSVVPEPFSLERGKKAGPRGQANRIDEEDKAEKIDDIRELQARIQCTQRQSREEYR